MVRRVRPFLAALALAGACSTPTLDLGRNVGDGSVDASASSCRGRTLCDTRDAGPSCVDTSVDPAHCGGCGRVCSSGACVAGACCPDTRPTRCMAGAGAACVDTSVDPGHCGGCGQACPSGACVGGACCPGIRRALACESGGARACVDPATDPRHCGACGVVCSAGPCVEGRCCEDEGLAACDEGGALRCVDVRAEAQHCGACGASCPAACAGGACCEPTCGDLCIPTRFEARSLAGGREAMGPVIADLDADGFDDVVWPTQLSNEIWISWGNRSGALLNPTRLRSGRVSPFVGVGDLDGDGLLDLAAPIQSRGPPFVDQIRIWYTRPDRTFEPGPVLEHPENPSGVAIARVDDDPHADLLLRLTALGCIGLRRGDGRGGFAPARCILDYEVDAYDPRILVLGAGPVTVAEVRGGVPPTLRLHQLDREGDLVETRLLALTERSVPAGGGVLRASPRRAEGLLLFSGGSDPIELVLDGGERCPIAFDLDTSTPFGPATPLTGGDFDGDGLLDFAGTGTCSFCESTLRVYLGRR